MKVELNVNATGDSSEPEAVQMHAPSCEVAIDVGQVLAANQALLKRMSHKMEVLEAKLCNMELTYAKQTAMLSHINNQTTFLLAPPKKEYKPWQPETPRLDSDYFSNFSWADKLFRPWKMRR